MKKRYLKTPEDVLALKNTDTKIYVDDERGYYKFDNGVLCAFDDEDDSWSICSTLYGPAEIYVLEEEPIQEATEKDIGKLCWVSDDDCGNRDAECFIAILTEVCDYGRRFRDESGSRWEHCFPLTKEEIKEFMEKAE